MEMPMRPSVPVGNPAVSLFHVAPASVDFHNADPGPPPTNPKACRRRWYVAAYKTLGSDVSSATSVTPVSWSPLSTSCHVRPPSLVLYNPRSALDCQSLPGTAA